MFSTSQMRLKPEEGISFEKALILMGQTKLLRNAYFRTKNLRNIPLTLRNTCRICQDVFQDEKRLPKEALGTLGWYILQASLVAMSRVASQLDNPKALTTFFFVVALVETVPTWKNNWCWHGWIQICSCAQVNSLLFLGVRCSMQIMHYIKIPSVWRPCGLALAGWGVSSLVLWWRANFGKTSFGKSRSGRKS